MEAWPHQTRLVSQTLAAIARGRRRLALTAPTGAGKSLMMQMLAKHYLDRGEGVTLYTNRRLLIEQISDGLTHARVRHGLRAAGYEPDPGALFQVASIQTEYSRCVRRSRWELAPSGLVLVDEGHLHTGPMSRAVLGRHHQAGAAYVLVTATPFGLGGVCEELIGDCTLAELRQCGALVWAHHYGPDEPDLRAFKKLREGEDLTEKENAAAVMRPGIFGRVSEAFDRLNPERKPTILFAPGVRESIWFAEQFSAKGVAAAHIDGQHVWIDGRLEGSSRDMREEVLDGSRTGRLVVLCNRFVLREGVDAPWLAHGILACVFGSLQSYLQAGGRLLRAHPALEHVTVQDHGGNWWRHGSLNDDREWRLGWTAEMACGLRADAMRAGLLKEPGRCPSCAAIIRGRSCRCGWEAKGREKVGRPVVAADGTLKHLTGDIFKPRRVCARPDGPALWERMYWRSRTAKGRRSFRAAMALFAQENDWGWPDRSWPFMPVDPEDDWRLVEDVPMDKLVRKGGADAGEG